MPRHGWYEARRGSKTTLNVKKISFFFKDTKPFAQLIGLFFLFVICMILAGGVAMLFPNGGHGEAAVRLQLLQQATTQLLTFMLPAVLFAVLFQPDADTSTSLKLRFQGRYWWLAFVGMVVMLLLVPLNDALTAWNKSWDLGPLEASARKMSDLADTTVEQMLSLGSTGDFLLQLLVVALIPAVCEELFFRAGLQQILQRWWGGKHVAVVVSAFVFTLAHGDLYGLVPRFVLGIVLGYLFAYSGSILVNVAAHFFNNALVVLLYHLYHRGMLSLSPSEPLLMPWHVVALCTLGALLLFLIYFLPKTAKSSRRDLV